MLKSREVRTIFDRREIRGQEWGLKAKGREGTVMSKCILKIGKYYHIKIFQ